ncbi:hypothetical protein ACFLUM_03770 [Chloroflexota bacterium]
MGYKGDVYVQAARVINPQMMEIPLPPKQVMCVYAGCARIDDVHLERLIERESLAVAPPSWDSKHVYVEIPTGERRWTDDPERPAGWTLLREGLATVGGGTFGSDGSKAPSGWCLGAKGVQIGCSPLLDGSRVDVPGQLHVELEVEVAGSGNWVLSCAYHVTVVGEILEGTAWPGEVART